jgi:valyl-tRNA synthetase
VAVLDWAGRTDAELEKFYPTSVLVTGYDILFFWARMMMFGTYVGVTTGADRPVPFTDAVPARLPDEHGRKISKLEGHGTNARLDRGSAPTRAALHPGARPTRARHPCR